MSTDPVQRPAGPYSEAAGALYAAGWLGVLPLPARSKSPPPDGYTGGAGSWPSRADVQSWIDERPGANVAIRLPESVLGIDIDDYAGKIGGTTFRLAVEKHGPLPPTWRSTSREHSISGIYLYAVPGGLAWPGGLGRDVELIQARHRYVVAPPSLHPNGARYRWIRPDGTTSLTPPQVDDLAVLPGVWVEALHPVPGGRAGVAHAVLDDAAVHAWLDQLGSIAEPACPAVARSRAVSLDELAAGARHPAALRATLRLAQHAADGHVGVPGALVDARAAFLAACADPARGSARSPGQAEYEWSTMLRGAVEVAGGDVVGDLDPCAYPFVGILGPGPSSVELREIAARLDQPPPPQSVPEAAAAVPVAPTEPVGGTPYEQWFANAVGQAVERLHVSNAAREVVDAERAAAGWSPPVDLGLRELLALPREPEPYTIEALLPTDGNVVVTAQFKAGKTTLVANLARSLVDGVPFLSFTVRERRRVTLWNFEVGQGQIAAWLDDLGIENVDDVRVLNLRGRTLPLSSPIARAYAIDSLRAHGTQCWIVDPFARSYDGESENDNSAVARYLDQLDDVKAAAGVRELVVVTHTGRAEQGAGAERARGATRLDDWPDARWLLVRDPETGLRYFRADGRDVEVPEGRLIFDRRRLTFDPSESRKSDTAGDLQRTILHAIGTQPGIGTRALRAFCREALGSASSQRVSEAVGALMSQQLVRTEQKAVGAAVEHYLGRGAESP